jgi:hypothetical protein
MNTQTRHSGTSTPNRSPTRRAGLGLGLDEDDTAGRVSNKELEDALRAKWVENEKVCRIVDGKAYGL